MKPDRWRQVDELFAAALEREPAERAAFLDSVCGNDRELRREVEKMLKCDEQATSFIKSDVFKLAAHLITEPSEEIPKPDQQTRRMARPTDSSRSFEPIDDARFISGEVLLDRYRIVGLLGRGGMGEVYRADDLKLKQPVALKFLPPALTMNGAALARFYKEVSVARQISHRHVCRVYDVGEYRGEHFLSMEFVRGEELSSLLKRIGRLPQDKAVDVARQLCAGLAAVHDRGVLHRDLKPQNIMLDERGEVRITDFGIAALATEISGREALAGTPAYMSPEQLEGADVTARSDIYSLGLVLYEVFTGKKAFDATTLAELINLRRSDTTPTSPGELVPELDPLVERVIFRCLSRDPAKRPASALQVAAALPGGDPLAAALAAGETPSPEMVAAAPKEGGLQPAVALALLAAALSLIVAVCFLSARVALYQRVPLNKSPEVLRDRAAELVKKFGHTTPPGDSAYGMGLDRDYLNYIHETDPSPSRWDQLNDGQPASIYFWFRQGPRPFDVPDNGVVTEGAPPPAEPGMITLTLDTLGRLRSFDAVPPKRAPAVPATTDWSTVFVESGLDQSKLQPVAPAWTSPRETTERVAWEGSYPDRPDVKLRVEAGSYDGKLVYFALFEPWDQTSDDFYLSRFDYVWLPNTAAAGYTYFTRYFFAQQQKEGSIIDERYNQGGQVADYIVNELDRKVMGFFATRDGRTMTSPMAGIFGPKVMIINESAGSGGDALPYMFKQRKLGPLVGTRTWGGLVGTIGVPQTIDGGGITAPGLAFYDLNGKWAVENEGITPDIEVEYSADQVLKGHDPQLERAVQEAMKLLEESPFKLVPRPAPIDRASRKGN